MFDFGKQSFQISEVIHTLWTEELDSAFIVFASTRNLDIDFILSLVRFPILLNSPGNKINSFTFNIELGSRSRAVVLVLVRIIGSEIFTNLFQVTFWVNSDDYCK